MTSFIKPPAGSKVNLTHPSSKGLLGAWLFNEGSGKTLNDGIGYNQGDLELAGADSADWSINEYGSTLKIATGNQYAPLGSASKIFRKKAGESCNAFSIVHCFKKTALPQVGLAFGVRVPLASPTSALATQIPNALGNISFLVGGNAISNFIATETPPVIDMDIWVFTNSPDRGMEIWQNGQLIVVGDKNPTWIVHDGQFVIGDPISDTPATDTYNGHPGEHNFLYIYDRAITPDEIANISRQPFEIFHKTFNTFIHSIPEHNISLRGYGGISLSGFVVTNSITAVGGIRFGGKSRKTDVINQATASYIIRRRNAIDIQLPWRNFTLPGSLFSKEAIALTYNLDYQKFFLGGTAKVGIDDSIPVYGGITLSGSSISDNSINTLGGITLSGSALSYSFDIIEEVLDGEGAKLSGSAFIGQEINIESFNGVVFSGDSVEEYIFTSKGGITLSGEAEKLPGSTTAFPTGRILFSGGNDNTAIMKTVPIRNRGVKLSGRMINTKRGGTRNIRKNIALVMTNNNASKDVLKNRFQKTVIMNSNSTPIVEEPVRLELPSEWCYIEECSDNVLPRIVINRQGEYIPPQKREAIERERQNASLT